MLLFCAWCQWLFNQFIDDEPGIFCNIRLRHSYDARCTNAHTTHSYQNDRRWYRMVDSILRRCTHSIFLQVLTVSQHKFRPAAPKNIRTLKYKQVQRLQKLAVFTLRAARDELFREFHYKLPQNASNLFYALRKIVKIKVYRTE